jgi:hypothetical protein
MVGTKQAVLLGALLGSITNVIVDVVTNTNLLTSGLVMLGFGLLLAKTVGGSSE